MMKAIVELTTDEHEKLSKIRDNVLTKVNGLSRLDYFDDYNRKSGYAHYEFSGKITDKLIELLGREPTSAEIIILVDGGFSHFGASCQIDDKRFSGRVNTD